LRLRQRQARSVFFQVPDSRRIFEDGAFWDIYYEHCSYFTEGSLKRLFRGAGFEIIDLWRDYGDQYLMIAARPGACASRATSAGDDLTEETATLVARFAEGGPRAIASWQERLRALQAAGRKTVLWGGGSKGVAFLTTLGVGDEVAYVVDVNPRKDGTYMAGTGHKIIGPGDLTDFRPDVAIVMNPIYREEIASMLTGLGLATELWTV
jgi:hypothetical protein